MLFIGGELMGEWPIKSANKETINSLEEQIDANKQLWQGKKLYIWGAGVRGTLTGLLLEQHGFENFLYIDGDSRKWGKNICGHSICSSVEFLTTCTQNDFILIPLEYSEEVKSTLLAYEFVEKENFLILKTNESKTFVNHFLVKHNSKFLMIGGSLFNEVSLCEKGPSLAERLSSLFGENANILSINCLSLVGYYHLIRMKIMCNYIPKETCIFLTWDLMTEYAHLLPRNQHVELFELLKKNCDIYDQSLDDFIANTQKRSCNYKLEFEKSPIRVFEGSRPLLQYIHRNYLEKSLLFSLETSTESFEYLNRIIDICKQYSIRCSIFFLPYNYQFVEDYFGKEARAIVNKNMKIIEDIFLPRNIKLYDLGRLLESQYFETTVTVNDAIYNTGIKKLAQEIYKILSNKR